MPEFESSPSGSVNAFSPPPALPRSVSTGGVSSLSRTSMEEVRRRREQREAQREAREGGDEHGDRNNFYARRRGGHQRLEDVTDEFRVALLKKEVMVIGQRNDRGVMVRMKEVNLVTGYYDQICVPAEGLEDLITALSEVHRTLYEQGLVKCKGQ